MFNTILLCKNWCRQYYKYCLVLIAFVRTYFADLQVKQSIKLCNLLQRRFGDSIELPNIELLAVTTAENVDITELVMIYKKDYVDDGQIYNFIVRIGGVIQSIPYSAENGDLLTQIKVSI